MNRKEELLVLFNNNLIKNKLIVELMEDNLEQRDLLPKEDVDGFLKSTEFFKILAQKSIELRNIYTELEKEYNSLVDLK